MIMDVNVRNLTREILVPTMGSFASRREQRGNRPAIQGSETDCEGQSADERNEGRRARTVSGVRILEVLGEQAFLGADADLCPGKECDH
jgi:hypothetical protein